MLTDPTVGTVHKGHTLYMFFRGGSKTYSFRPIGTNTAQRPLGIESGPPAVCNTLDKI